MKQMALFNDKCEIQKPYYKKINKLDQYSKPYRICCAPGCRSNFTIDDSPIQTFAFPEDKVLRKKWLLAVKADHNVKLIAPQICIKHFEEHFILRQIEFEDSTAETIAYAKVELAENAVPTIFFNEQLLSINYKNEVYADNEDVQSTYSKIEKTQNFCRICLASNIRLITLATVHHISCNAVQVENNENGSLFEHFFDIETSALPTWLKICFLCHNQLENFFTFQKKAIDVHKNLTEIYKDPQLMKILCKNSEEKYFITNEDILSKNSDDNDNDLIEDEWNEMNMTIYEEQYLCDNNDEVDSENSMSSFNEEMVEYLDPETSILDFSCLKCSKQFNSQISFDLHMKYHNEKNSSSPINNNIYKGECCLTEFLDEDILISHIKQHCNKLENCEIKCDNCNERFSCRSVFNKHIISCNKITLKYFKCRLCVQTFSKEKVFKNHLQSHKKSRNTQCPICNQYIFTNYNEHIMEKHGISIINDDEEMLENENITCQLCNIIYGTKDLLQQHLYHDHLVEYKFKCPYSTCQISLLNEVYLKNHIADHQDAGKQNFLSEINKQILKSKITVGQENIDFGTESVHINNDSTYIPTISNQTKYTIHDMKDIIDGDYEIIIKEEERKSAYPSDDEISSYNHGRETVNKNKIEYVEGENLIVNRQKNYNSIQNVSDEEENFFEIAIRPDFY